MEKTEIVAKLKALRSELKAKKIESMKTEIKDTSIFRKMKREIAQLLTKLSTSQHGA